MRLEERRRAFHIACDSLKIVWLGRAWLRTEQSKASKHEREIVGQLRRREAEVESTTSQVNEKQGAVDKAGEELSLLMATRVEGELAIARYPPPARYTPEDAARLEPAANLQAERDRLTRDLADATRYPDDVRDPLVHDQCEAERDRLVSVNDLIADTSKEIEDRAKLVETARKSYDDHIRALVRELRNKFVEVCSIAGVAGDIRLIAGDIPGEHGVDVLVSHKAGEDPVSYQHDSHSGGQGTKISILLLLAAMSLGRTADLLIVDEHKAHLDGTNSSQITEIMRNLGTKVQFVLSAPTDAKSTDSDGDWCDVQVTFLPRNPGEAFSPPVRLMSRLVAGQFEERFHSLQQPLM